MDMTGKTLRRLGEQLPGCVSIPGSDRYAAATAIWAKPVGPKPRAIVHCSDRRRRSVGHPGRARG